MLRVILGLAMVLSLGCGDDDAPLDSSVADTGSDVFAPSDAADAPVDAVDDAVDGAVDTGVDAGESCEGPPGLYQELSCTELAEGVMPYNPQYWLWSDGSDKARFIFVPPGEVIDTSDPDGWIFPPGTRIWKTFSLGGVRLETRYFEKTRAGDGLLAWRIQTFQWTDAQDAVFEVTAGATDVLGTDHDIPAVALCGQCHDGGGQPDVVLGFSALQLNHTDTDISLTDLNGMGLLGAPVAPATARVPSSDLVTEQALGYLHANCSHCHGGALPRAGLSLFVATGLATVEETGVYLTAINQPSMWIGPGATLRIVPGMPDISTLPLRMSMRDRLGNQMPPLATEFADPTGLSSVREWILSLPTE